MTLSRREALCGLTAGACALACGGGAEAPGARAACTGARDGAAGWVEVRLDDYPALREVGGSAAVQRPEAFLDVLVFHSAPGCYGALWRVCTHGACTVDYVQDAHTVECPCHGSRFDEEGQVVRGPASRALLAFDVAREGDSLYLRRRT